MLHLHLDERDWIRRWCFEPNFIGGIQDSRRVPRTLVCGPTRNPSGRWAHHAVWLRGAPSQLASHLPQDDIRAFQDGWRKTHDPGPQVVLKSLQ